jgi:hypothetical protein
MEPHPRRDELIASIFAEALDPLHRLFARLDLAEEEQEALDQELFAWFFRFSRRCGHDRLSAPSLVRALVLGAVQLMRDVAVLKHCEIPLLPRDLKEIAEQLGIDLDESPEAKT